MSDISKETGGVFDLFPGFKTPPNDPSRELKRTALTICGLPAVTEADRQRWEDEDFNRDFDNESVCKHCEGWGYTDCFCGGDFCVCSYNGEITCYYCV